MIAPRAGPRLFAIAAVLVLAAGALITLFGCVETIPPKDLTLTRMALIEERSRVYWTSNHRAPPALSALPMLPGRDNSTVDGWGRPIEYVLTAPAKVRLQSAGPNPSKPADQIVIAFDLAAGPI